MEPQVKFKRVILQPLKETRSIWNILHPFDFISFSPWELCVWLLRLLTYPRLAMMFSQRGVLGCLLSAPYMSRWIGQRPHLPMIFPQPTPRRRLWSRCLVGSLTQLQGGKQDPCYGCQWFSHSLASNWTSPNCDGHIAVYLVNMVMQHFSSGKMA